MSWIYVTHLVSNARFHRRNITHANGLLLDSLSVFSIPNTHLQVRGTIDETNIHRTRCAMQVDKARQVSRLPHRRTRALHDSHPLVQDIGGSSATSKIA